MPKLAKSQTPFAIANAKPKAKAYKLADGLGLFLLVQPTGAKWWRFVYRRPDTRKRNMLSLGTYPSVSLREARAQRDDLRASLANGIDPGHERKSQQREASKQRAEEHALYQFSFAVTADRTLTLTVRGNTLRLTRHQTDAVRSALLATQG